MEPSPHTRRLRNWQIGFHALLLVALLGWLGLADAGKLKTVAGLAGWVGLCGSAWASWRLHFWSRQCDRFAHGLRNQLLEQIPGEATGDLDPDLEPPYRTLAKRLNEASARTAGRYRELELQFERLSTVLHSMDEGVIAIDKDERVLLANTASRTMIRFMTDDCVGRPFLGVSRNWAVCEALRKCLTTGRPQNREVQSTHEPVRTLSLSVSCLPGSPPPGAVAVLHDVTELRRLENLRYEFVTNVSHELKTPLAAIIAYAETLKLGAIHDDENNVQFVSRIEEQAERLHQLIQDMLQIARVESGQEVMDIVPLALATVLQATLAQHADAARRKEIDLALELGNDLVIQADEHGLQTIFDNLVSNAIKYTPVGGHVTMRLRRDGQEAVVEVEDDGIGIAPENQPRVFERFFRADKSRSRAIISTGLGLSIVKHLSQAFGGSVAVRSKLGRGSTFSVRFPIAEPTPDAEPSSRVATSPTS